MDTPTLLALTARWDYARRLAADPTQFDPRQAAEHTAVMLSCALIALHVRAAHPDAYSVHLRADPASGRLRPSGTLDRHTHPQTAHLDEATTAAITPLAGYLGPDTMPLWRVWCQVIDNADGRYSLSLNRIAALLLPTPQQLATSAQPDEPDVEPLNDDDVPVRVQIELSERVSYELDTVVWVPEPFAGDPPALTEYLAENEDLWLDALHPIDHFESVDERDVLHVTILPAQPPDPTDTSSS